MTDTPAPTRASLRRYGWLLAPLFTLLIPFAVWLVQVHQTQRQVDAAMARLRRQGARLTWEQLVPEIPAGSPNAANVYQLAFAARQEVGRSAEL